MYSNFLEARQHKSPLQTDVNKIKPKQSKNAECQANAQALIQNLNNT